MNSVWSENPITHRQCQQKWDYLSYLRIISARDETNVCEVTTGNVGRRGWVEKRNCTEETRRRCPSRARKFRVRRVPKGERPPAEQTLLRSRTLHQNRSRLWVCSFKVIISTRIKLPRFGHSCFAASAIECLSLLFDMMNHFLPMSQFALFQTSPSPKKSRFNYTET